MRIFERIVFVSQAVSDDVDALKQALTIAHSNNATLSALIACPEFPPQQAQYRERYERSLAQHLAASIQAAREATGISAVRLPVAIEVEGGSMPAVRIIRHVLQYGFDLVIKEADREGDGRGFKAVDMELLRKCPCPVWLNRSTSTAAGITGVAVAIDPQSPGPAAGQLSLRLLQLARSIADDRAGELHIVSCWDYPFEEYLRNNVWMKMSDDAILETVLDAQRRHRADLDSILKESAVGGAMRIHHVRGQPEKIIPPFVADHRIDLLVMGTVARTGIPGFVIGNTAENICRQLDCALLAAKPDGFDSPITIS